jgi:hypothetical protein
MCVLKCQKDGSWTNKPGNKDISVKYSSANPVTSVSTDFGCMVSVSVALSSVTSYKYSKSSRKWELAQNDTPSAWHAYFS